ncbi:MAG: hypothetical protein ABR598_03015 [Candidatus Dormibacteria bacterium]
MRFVRAALKEIVGLFVADWTQTIGILLILIAGYVGLRVFKFPGAAFAVGLLLAAHLVFTTLTEARRRAEA